MYLPTAMRCAGRSACGFLRLRGANCCGTGASRWLDVFTSPSVNRAIAGSGSGTVCSLDASFSPSAFAVGNSN